VTPVMTSCGRSAGGYLGFRAIRRTQLFYLPLVSAAPPSRRVRLGICANPVSPRAGLLNLLGAGCKHFEEQEEPGLEDTRRRRCDFKDAIESDKHIIGKLIVNRNSM
jgi:hypothetical protein